MNERVTGTRWFLFWPMSDAAGLRVKDVSWRPFTPVNDSCIETVGVLFLSPWSISVSCFSLSEIVTWPEIRDGQKCRGVNVPGITLNQ